MSCCRGRLVFDSIAVLVVVCGVSVGAQISTNPYRAIYGWEKLPAGRGKLGRRRRHLHRPGQETHLDAEPMRGRRQRVSRTRRSIRSSSSIWTAISSRALAPGMFDWPHGFFVDHEGNVWVTEGAPAGEARGAEGHKVGKGHQVFKFSPDGKVLMTLGDARRARRRPDALQRAVPRAGGAERRDLGDRRSSRRQQPPGQVHQGRQVHHAGGRRRESPRRWSAARSTTRITSRWTRRAGSSSRIAGTTAFRSSISRASTSRSGRSSAGPSAIAIDAQDRIYVVDGTSASPRPLASSPRAAGPPPATTGVNNPGYESGIRIGDARTGWITEFIPEMPLRA